MMKNVTKYLIALFSIVILSSCSQKNFVEQGTPLNKEKVKNIVEGSTTESQIISLFGKPTSQKELNSNETQWTYQYTKKSSTSHMLIGEIQYDIVEGKLDIIISKGVVTWFNYDEHQKQKKW
ncbi:outer membrane protein assembly factor BamE domain-containing protein [Gilliamella sp. App6-5]|jgi:outer membrane protein assembly factor BamE (lipoprotein component of BamABCDE complex)|uniref:outer membrane protein assembly factor BamE domain-containing protein n=1 Tax=Gilliamella sp. App6-5 TaxID=3120232 RepID=UPI0009BCE72D|nr:outer membrane protein assembly factor BamE [Gilliamella apicola]